MSIDQIDKSDWSFDYYFVFTNTVWKSILNCTTLMLNLDFEPNFSRAVLFVIKQVLFKPSIWRFEYKYFGLCWQLHSTSVFIHHLCKICWTPSAQNVLNIFTSYSSFCTVLFLFMNVSIEILTYFLFSLPINFGLCLR